MEEEHEIKTISEETAQEFLQSLLDIADDSPFSANDLQLITNRLTSIIFHELAERLLESAFNYFKCKVHYRFLSKKCFRWYYLKKTRKALIKYRKAFHDFEDFKREFGYEMAESKKDGRENHH